MISDKIKSLFLRETQRNKDKLEIAKKLLNEIEKECAFLKNSDINEIIKKEIISKIKLFGQLKSSLGRCFDLREERKLSIKGDEILKEIFDLLGEIK